MVDVRQLRTDDEALICCQSPYRVSDAAKLLACDDECVHGRPRVGDLDSVIPTTGERGGILQRRLQRAASAERPPTVAHAGEEAQLDCVCDVPAIRERGPAACVRDELKGRLAVTVFEILPSQSMPVDAKQQLAPRARDDRDVLCRIMCRTGARARPSAAPSSFFRLTSGRHMKMSLSIACRPPSQLRRDANCRVRANASASS